MAGGDWTLKTSFLWELARLYQAAYEALAEVGGSLSGNHIK
jgi:hypothetical protein